MYFNMFANILGEISLLQNQKNTIITAVMQVNWIVPDLSIASCNHSNYHWIEETIIIILFIALSHQYPITDLVEGQSD